MKRMIAKSEGKFKICEMLQYRGDMPKDIRAA
jgi:hypothetical protein